MKGQAMTDEALANAGYVNHINKVSGGNYTWEDLKQMGLPTHVSPEGWVTWE
jgi:hypothetical protein